jgi:ABC-type branched-subunit amino acid transport system substrate-binding protein
MKRSPQCAVRPPSRAAVCLLLVACLPALAACCPPGGAKPTVKIGLAAPFEGRQRDLGYEALYALRLAVRQRNEAGGVGGRYLVEMVALNDFDEPEAALEQAHKMAVDPDVLAVLGGWSPATAAAAGPAYESLGLAFLSPPDRWPAGEITPETAAAYETLSGGVPPGPAAAWTYGAANRLLDAIDAAIRAGDRPIRPQVAGLLEQVP